MENNQIIELELLSVNEIILIEGGNLIHDFGRRVGNWAWDTLKDVAEGKQTLMHSGGGYMLH
jgi:hypothetical protein